MVGLVSKQTKSWGNNGLHTNSRRETMATSVSSYGSSHSSSGNSRNRVAQSVHYIRHHVGTSAGVFVSVVTLTAAGVYASNNPPDTPVSSQPKASQQAVSQPTTAAANDTQPQSQSNATTSGEGISTSVNSTTNQAGQTSTKVTVNGQEVTVPDNGSTGQTINTANGQVNINVNNSNSSSFTNYDTDSSSLNISTQTNFTTGGGQTQ